MAIAAAKLNYKVTPLSATKLLRNAAFAAETAPYDPAPLVPPLAYLRSQYIAEPLN